MSGLKNNIAGRLVAYFPENIQEDVWACFVQRGDVAPAERVGYPPPMDVLTTRGSQIGWTLLCAWQDRPWLMIFGLLGVAVTLGRGVAQILRALLSIV